MFMVKMEKKYFLNGQQQFRSLARHLVARMQSALEALIQIAFSLSIDYSSFSSFILALKLKKNSMW